MRKVLLEVRMALGDNREEVAIADEHFAPTASRYNRAFDLQAVGERVGYPAYLKPFHGGGWSTSTASPTPTGSRPPTTPPAGS
jgi:hypothetical protein